MFESLRYSRLSLRIGLAIVYLWFGIDKFLHPEYWHTASVVILLGIIEVLIATSLVTGFFVRIFAAIAIVFLLCGCIIHGLTEASVGDVAIIAGLFALSIWPERRYI